MKIAVYKFKENSKYNGIRDIQELNDIQYQKALDLLENFNNNEKNDVIGIVLDTKTDILPDDVIEYLLKMTVNKKQVKLQDIIKKLSDLEDAINDIDFNLSDVIDDIKEVLKDE